jgi:uncharacterized membrane protein
MEWLIAVTEKVIVVIYAIALLTIVVGTVEVVIGIVRVTWRRLDHHAMRAIWLEYSRWLVAALTFQLAADILETSISTSWETVGRVGAIAVIRTFLNFFLDRDVEEIRARQRATESRTRPASP